MKIKMHTAQACIFFQCTRQDLNLHESLHTPLKRTCLPFHHWCVLSYYTSSSDFVKGIYYNFFMKFFVRTICIWISVFLLSGCTREIPKAPQADPSTYKPMESLPLLCDYVYLIDPDTGQTLIDRGS